MKASEIVIENLFGELLGGRFERYKVDLRTANPEKSIKVYSDAIRAFRKLSPSEQDAICNFFRVVAVDTASIILGGIDGTTDIGVLDGQFTVIYDGEEIQGELQDRFLSKVEASGLLER